MTFNGIGRQFNKNYKHRMSDDTACAVCGTHFRPLAFHALQKSFPQNSSTPKGFVATSLSMGLVQGAFPVCNQCAPACSRCGLPILTEKILEFGRLNGANVALGVCRHVHIVEYLKALTKRALRIGRFHLP